MLVITVVFLLNFVSQSKLSSDIEKKVHNLRHRRSFACTLPPYPDFGYYTSNVPLGSPGQSFPTILLNVTCHPGYMVQGSTDALCYQGTWIQPIPKCVRASAPGLQTEFCELTRHPSVRYQCLVEGPVVGHRACGAHEPSGTVVRPECNAPHYYSTDILPFMRCVDGKWDYIARCSPECGRITPDGAQLITGGVLAKRGELPWHTGIYKKTFQPYKQICGGSLVTNTVVISAAHCFYGEYLEPPSDFAAAIGKLRRPFNDVADDETDAQKSDVKDIKVPARFRGRKANFQDDIALVYLTQAFVYQTHVRPVCLSFDYDFDRRQLAPGSVGKVAGWGLTSSNGPASPKLNVVQLPYVDITYCIDKAPPGFIEYITSDKICAGYENNGTAVCQGDSGGGLVFSEWERGVQRFYLRGVVSTAPDDANLCNTQSITTFTHIVKHEHFIKANIYNPLEPPTCIPPAPPARGSYTTSAASSSGGQNFPSLRLHVSCRPGHRRVGAAEIDCVGGLWSDTMPKCVRDLSQGDECTWKGVVGTCVPPHKCLTTLDNVSEEKHPMCSKDGEPLKICCTDCMLINDISKAVVSPVKGEGLFWKDGRKARDNCLQFLERLPHRCRKLGVKGGIKGQLDGDKQCQVYESWGEGRDKLENAGDYPFVALLGYGETLDKVDWRGDIGIIISDKYVLTTAWRSTEPHNGGLNYLAVGVESRTGSPQDWQVHEINRHVIHTGYVRYGFYNDLSLLETKGTIQFSETVLPACLPSEDLKDDEATLITYWNGKTKASSDAPRGVRVQKHTEEECSRTYDNYNTTTQECYGNRQDFSKSCDTWSGDPLVVTNHITSCLHTVIAIKWYGASCSAPDSYTMIHHYTPWIESVVWP